MPRESFFGHSNTHSLSRNGFNEQLGFVREPKGRVGHRDRRAWNRGIKSVQNVLGVLAGMPNISEVSCTLPNSEDDLNGKDIIAFVSDIGKVSIQVKSSRSRIRKFKQDMGERHGIVPGKIEQFLRNQRIIVVNGASKQKIEGSITTQLNDMRPVPSWIRKR